MYELSLRLPSSLVYILLKKKKNYPTSCGGTTTPSSEQSTYFHHSVILQRKIAFPPPINEAPSALEVVLSLLRSPLLCNGVVLGSKGGVPAVTTPPPVHRRQFA
ncbi:hypothetical protein GDO81_019029 [Engystomops pustulosus]|uniref:Uncharacterized protein n=1 Tax=Engystomops pustulosus TaxID=76066 RepID=A0AAV6YAG9_ENGPU|nr:hypothetical protein GDO81_019029 [Engystomops pustulosus]